MKLKKKIVIIIIALGMFLLAMQVLFNGDYYNKRCNYAHALFAYKNQLFLIKVFNKKDYPENILKLTEFYNRQGLYDEAIASAKLGLREINKINPENEILKDKLNISMAKSYMFKGDDRIAETILLKMEKENRANARKITDSFFRLDGSDKKHRVCEIPLFYGYDETYRLLGVLSYRAKKFDKAKEYLNSCCKKPFVEFADLELEQNNSKKAEKYLLSGFLYTPNSITLFRQDNSEEAIIYIARLYSTLAKIYNSENNTKTEHYYYKAFDLYNIVYGKNSPEAFCANYLLAKKTISRMEYSPFILPKKENILPIYIKLSKNILFARNNKINTETLDNFCKTHGR